MVIGVLSARLQWAAYKPRGCEYIRVFPGPRLEGCRRHCPKLELYRRTADSRRYQYGHEVHWCISRTECPRS
eukprot:scaffold374_cov380-Prasinococcus_capsulatus_cf.AAC.7